MSTSRIVPLVTPQMPSTPVVQSQQSHTPNGSWKHPKFDEIARRQYVTAFDERNVRAIVANAGLLFLSFYASTIISHMRWLGYAASPISALVDSLPYSSWIVGSIRLIFAINVAIAFRPLLHRYYPDDIADIPLTPSQRASMGLKEDVPAPQTPGSAYASPNYVTPPRYQRSTPRSSSYSQSDYASQSPLTGSPRIGPVAPNSDSPFSPNITGSPLFSRALAGGGATKRLSYGGSPTNSSFFGDSSSTALPSTPTPAIGKTSVGLNNKWLYEKRRDNPKSSLFM